MSCLDNIVTLGLCPDEGTPTSGFQLMDAAGISTEVLSDIVNADDTSGLSLVMAKKSLAIRTVTNDFVASLMTNNVSVDISNKVYQTGARTDVTANLFSGFRGVRLHKVAKGASGGVKQYKINSVRLYPTSSGTVTLRVEIGSNIYLWNILLVGNTENVFSFGTDLTGMPEYIDDYVNQINVYVDSANIEFYQTSITCMQGCNSTMPNPCMWGDGWTGLAAAKTYGYGLVVDFSCNCNYEKIICDLSKTFSGELIFLKWQILIFDEWLKSTRFNNLVVYGKQEVNEIYLPQLRSQYNARWAALMSSAKSILKKYKGDCVICDGIRWVTNI